MFDVFHSCYLSLPQRCTRWTGSAVTLKILKRNKRFLKYNLALHSRGRKSLFAQVKRKTGYDVLAKLGFNIVLNINIGVKNLVTNLVIIR